MNPKIEKVYREIEKTRVKITEAQERLRKLEEQKIDLENTEIVSLFRSATVAPVELAAVIRAFREKGAIVPAAEPVADYGRDNGFNSAPEEDVFDE